MENDRIAKWICKRECSSSRSLDRPRIDTVKNCLKKIGLDVRQAGRMVHDGIP